MLRDLSAYGRFVVGLGPFLRSRMSSGEADEIIQTRLERRAEALLHIVERGIYANPRSPYLPMLRLAGCELGDFRKLVGDLGVERALAILRREGVFVSFEEFKGRRPIVRRGVEIPGGAKRFDNPSGRWLYHGHTSGSTGTRTRIAIDIDHLRETNACQIVALKAHGAFAAPEAMLRDILPSLAGLATALASNQRGCRIDRWFSPLAPSDLRPSLKDRAALLFTLASGKIWGAPMPAPESVSLEQPEPVLRWLRDALDREGRCLLRSHVGYLLRVALFARERGVDLTGAIFWGAGESPSEAKVAPMREVGARFVPTYFLSEVGPLGFGCAAPVTPNDLHVTADTVALIQHPVEVPETGLHVDGLVVTALLPTAPKILLNVETDDFAVIERRSCGCPLERLGYAWHVRDVQSYRKLTVEGMSLVGSEMVRVLEEVLPHAFGGTPFDFQLVQEEDERGLSRLVLLVHPRLPIDDERAVVDIVLKELGRGDAASELARAVWNKARSLTVRREAPEPAGSGKWTPLRSRTGDAARPVEKGARAGG